MVAAPSTVGFVESDAHSPLRREKHRTVAIQQLDDPSGISRNPTPRRGTDPSASSQSQSVAFAPRQINPEANRDTYPLILQEPVTTVGGVCGEPRDPSPSCHFSCLSEQPVL